MVNSRNSISEQIDLIKRQLVDKGYKLTQQREVTVRVLLEHEKDHFSAEEVFLLVKEKFPEIGLATVYRTLELLSDLQVVEKINLVMERLALIFAVPMALIITIT